MATVLVAEPNAALQQMLVIALRAHGHDVVSSDTGEDALRHLESGRWDCVVIGAPFPIGPGRTLLEHLENEPRDLQRLIVMTTRVTNEMLLRRAARLEVYAIFAEPCDINDLMKTVASCTAGQPPPRRWFGFPEAYLNEIFGSSPHQQRW